MVDARADNGIRAGLRDQDAESKFEALAWLADAPLFVDSDQVAGFYDAVVRPEGRRGTTVMSLERLEGRKTSLEGSVEVEVGLSKFITTLLPFLDVKAKASGGVGHERSDSETRGETIELHAIDTPQRQLVHLTLHDFVNLPDRFRVVADPTTPGWCDQSFISELPRALVFLDFPCGTKFIPMAAEVEKGLVVTIYDKLSFGEESPPAYPERFGPANEQEHEQKRGEYWNWFGEHFSPKGATEKIEQMIASGGRVQWIDYRIPLWDRAPLHLHVCGRGQYDTGTFAYNLAKRGFDHGLRIVGTLKSEPDVNVLAIFEK